MTTTTDRDQLREDVQQAINDCRDADSEPMEELLHRVSAALANTPRPSAGLLDLLTKATADIAAALTMAGKSDLIGKWSTPYVEAINTAALATPTTLDPATGDLVCGDCGRDNPVWFAPNDLWNLVMGGPDAKEDPGGILCPTCFAHRAETAFPNAIWSFSQKNALDPATIEHCAKIAENATLPEDYIWGRDAMGQFDFGKERAAAAIRASVETRT